MLLFLFVPSLNLLVDIIDNRICQLILRDDEDGEQQQGGWNDTYQPENTLLSLRSLLHGLRIVSHVSKDGWSHHTTQGHTRLEEDARQGIHDTCNTLATLILSIRDNLRNKSPTYNR